MRIEKYYNISKEEVDLKKQNIFIPICLGNKFFSEKGVLSLNVRDYLNWALTNTRDKVLFLIVDKIQDTNFFVRNSNKSEKASLVRVLEEGKKLQSAVRQLLMGLPEEQQERTDVIRWEDYQNSDPLWGHITHLVYKEFKNNEDFNNTVLNCVKTSVTDRPFSDKDYIRLCDYVLDEFCLAYSGVSCGGEHFGLYVYPVTDSVLELIEGIKNGAIFPKLHDKLPKIKTGVLLLN